MIPAETADELAIVRGCANVALFVQVHKTSGKNTTF